MDRVYARLRPRPSLVDGVLAAALLIGGLSDHLGSLAVLPASLALAGLVAVRRRFPAAAYAAAVIIGIAQVTIGIGPASSPLTPTIADVGILILLYTLAAERPRRVSLPGLAAAVALFAVGFAWWGQGSQRPAEFLVVGVLILLIPVSAWVLGDSMGTRRAYSAAMEERAARAERERDSEAQIATAAERARIARELHDVIAHNLSVMVAQADGGAYVFDAMPERSREALAEIGRTGRQALAEMSSLLGLLRPDPEAAPLAPAPVAGEIDQLVSQAREAGMSVSQTVEGAARPLPGGLSLAAYRIVQEALTNVRKHAGPDASAEVTLRYGDGELVIRVTDDGRPAELPRYGAAAARSGGHGLTGMRERAAMYGGTVKAGPRPDAGFEVTARLPFPAPATSQGRTASRGAA